MGADVADYAVPGFADAEEGGVVGYWDGREDFVEGFVEVEGCGAGWCWVVGGVLGAEEDDLRGKGEAAEERGGSFLLFLF